MLRSISRTVSSGSPRATRPPSSPAKSESGVPSGRPQIRRVAKLHTRYIKIVHRPKRTGMGWVPALYLCLVEDEFICVLPPLWAADPNLAFATRQAAERWAEAEARGWCRKNFPEWPVLRRSSRHSKGSATKFERAASRTPEPGLRASLARSGTPWCPVRALRHQFCVTLGCENVGSKETDLSVKSHDKRPAESARVATAGSEIAEPPPEVPKRTQKPLRFAVSGAPFSLPSQCLAHLSDRPPAATGAPLGCGRT